MTAHPKIDPVTGELIFFGVSQSDKTEGGAWMHYSVADKDGQLTEANVPVPLRGPQIMHDIAITEHCTVVLDFPLFFRTPKPGQSPYHHVLKASTRFGVMPRHPPPGAALPIQWFTASSCFCYHVANAWEHRDLPGGHRGITIIGCRSPHMDQGGLGSSVWRMHRWDLDLDTGKLVEERELCDVQCEFPVVPARLVGRPCRFVYAARFVDQGARMARGAAPAFDGLIKVDVVTGDVVTHMFEGGARMRGGEAVFAPLRSSRGGGGHQSGSREEEGGVLVTFVHDEGEEGDSEEAILGRCSEMHIIDARTMQVQARVQLPNRVPYGFHGTWVDAVQ
jgi:carotenoid cleavage dioxygenase